MPKKPDKNLPVEQNSNDSKRLNSVDDIIDETISSFGASRDDGDERRDKCILYWDLGHVLIGKC